MVDQLLREWPPGYGGVERVVHHVRHLVVLQLLVVDEQVLRSGDQLAELLIHPAHQGADDQTGGAGEDADFVINVERHS